MSDTIPHNEEQKRYIGFDRRLALAWLDETAELMQRHANPSVVRRYLHTALADEIPAEKARGNTITVLGRIWIRPRYAQHLHDEAIDLLPGLRPEERLWLHWGLTLLAFPFFRDVAATVGQLLNAQSQCSMPQITAEVMATWGQRSTLVRAVRRAVRSCVAWGMLTEGTLSGIYQASTIQKSTNRDVHHWFLDAVLHAHEPQGVWVEQLPVLPETYPFDLTFEIDELLRLDRFEVRQERHGSIIIYPRSPSQKFA